MKKLLGLLFGVLFSIPAISATLPSGYTELEYIQGDGKAWINTGLVPTTNTNFEIQLEYTDLSSTQGVIGYLSNSVPTTNFYVAKSSSANKLLFASGTDAQDITNITVSANTVYTYKLNGNVLSINDSNINIQRGTLNATNTTMFIMNRGGSSNGLKGKVYYVKIWNGDTLVLDLVPVKKTVNGTDVYGMYNVLDSNPETAFYGNAGTGAFTGGDPVANTCPNLFDTQIEQGNIGNDGANISSSARVRTAGYISVSPNTTYTLSVDIDDYTGSSSGGVFLRFYNASSGDFAEHYLTSDGWHDPRGGYTFTTPAGAYGLRIIFAKGSTSTTITPSKISNIQLEEGSTATEYCAKPVIKIATRAYNTTQFAPVVTALNSAIDTIKDVVTNTINQTAAVSALQSTKQTRPDEECPAGKKCLLVEDVDGTPHWYEIIENIYGLPTGYTPLEYIQSTGTQYIDTNITGSTNAIIDMQGTSRSDENVVFMLAPINATAYQNGFGQYKGQIAGANEIDDIATRRVYNVSYTSSSMTVNGITFSYYIANNVNLALFGSTATNRRIRDAKLYSAKIYNNNTLVADFVPAQNSSGVIGLYDLADPNPATAFHTNQGTGTFTAGPVVQ